MHEETTTIEELEAAAAEAQAAEQQAAEAEVTEPAEAAPATEGAPALAWGHDHANDDVIYAGNTAGIEIEEDQPAIFAIEKRDDGTYDATILTSEQLIHPADVPDPFPTLDAAKAWCEARNAELVAAAAKEIVDEADAQLADVRAAAPIPADQPTAEGPLPSPSPGELMPPQAQPEPAGDAGATAAPAPQDDKPGSAGPAPAPPDLEHWTMIVKARDDERQAEARVIEAQLELKAAKADLDAASEKLGKLIDEAKYPTLWSGSSGPRRAPSDPTPLADALPEIPAADAPPEPAQDDAWRLVTLEDLGIKGRALKALHEHNPPITAHGELSDWQTKKGDFWAKDVKGLGAKAREDIENAQAAYWTAHPRFTNPPQEGDAVLQTDAPADRLTDQAGNDASVDTSVESSEPERHEPGAERYAAASVAEQQDPTARQTAPLPADYIDLAGHGGIQPEQGRDGWQASYAVRVGPLSSEGRTGIAPDRAGAVRAAAGEIKGWLEKAGKGFRGDGHLVAREIMTVVTGLLPLELAEAKSG